ncbi:hypothetical protein Busp01_37580 [Trinickia caryophylli]|nr:hypothetical protein Busp01_37580 [Trinickia caryophylli]
MEEFDGNANLRRAVLAACEADSAQLRNDPNCANATAARKVAAHENAAPGAHTRDYEAKRTVATQDIAIIVLALTLYRLDNGTYPSQAQGLRALVEKPVIEPIPENWRGGYLARLPDDPFGHPYQYLNPGPHGEIEVVSLGADGQPNGHGKDADIGSWDPAVAAAERNALRSKTAGANR